MKKNIINIVALITAVIALILIIIKLNSNKADQQAAIYKPDINTKVLVQAEKTKEQQFIEKVSFVG
jgi:Flp pilus assembly protein protease CpaA